jgi:hypothetical protein
MRGAASLFLPDLKMRGTLARAWQSELSALEIDPNLLDEQVRTHIEVTLAACVVDASALASAAAYCIAERMTASRRALDSTGDMRAALTALCPVDRTTPAGRAEALTLPALRDLLDLATALL